MDWGSSAPRGAKLVPIGVHATAHRFSTGGNSCLSWRRFVGELSQETSRFIDRYVDSVERLEVLLLLQRERERSWTAAQVAAELRIGPASADRELARLVAGNLASVRVGQDLYYRFDPRPAHVAKAADDLAIEYGENRLSVIRRVLERPATSLRDFADAFRLSKREDDG